MPKKENPKKKTPSKAKDLSKIPNPPVEELSQEELDKVAGGGQFYLKLDGIKGESADDKHRG